MKFSRAEIPDIIIIEPSVFSDDRGYFFESFKQNELNDFLGYDVNFVKKMNLNLLMEFLEDFIIKNLLLHRLN